MTEVATFLSPRKKHAKWVDYGEALRLQRLTAQKFGHKHTLISDSKYKGFNVFTVPHVPSLMHAILEGQIAFLEAWEGDTNVVLLDADCLIGRNLDDAFTGDFDIALTNRNTPHKSPINNGAMYVSGGSKVGALKFFRRALALCHEEWGGDQEAISQAAAPVPLDHSVQERDGVHVSFVSLLTHNVVPEMEGVRHKRNPFVIHFKGEGRKAWMATYARCFLEVRL